MKENIKQKILQEIMEDKVKMKPKYLFWFQTIVLLFSILFTLILSVYIFSFIAFLFVDQGLLLAPRFGMRGILETLSAFPLLLTLLGIFGIYITLKLAKYFEFVYKRKVVNTFLSVLVFIIISQIIFIFSGAQEYIKREAFKRQIPLVPQMFQDMRDRKNPQIIVGKVIATSTESITIINRRGHILEIPIATITSITSFNNLKNESLVQILLDKPLERNEKEQKNVFVQDILIIE
jgi:hypothetical protein